MSPLSSLTPAQEWPLLILGLLGWVIASALATVMAVDAIRDRRTARDDQTQHENEAIALTKEGPCEPPF